MRNIVLRPMQDGGAELGRAVIVCVQQDEYASLISRLAGSQLQVAVELLFPVEELVALDENGAQHLGISRGCAPLGDPARRMGSEATSPWPSTMAAIFMNETPRRHEGSSLNKEA